MKKFLSRLFDLICFVVGPMLAAYHIFNFYYSYSELSGGKFYYSDDSKLFIAIGVALTCIGFLRKYWTKKD